MRREGRVAFGVIRILGRAFGGDNRRIIMREAAGGPRSYCSRLAHNNHLRTINLLAAFNLRQKLSIYVHSTILYIACCQILSFTTEIVDNP